MVSHQKEFHSLLAVARAQNAKKPTSIASELGIRVRTVYKLEGLNEQYLPPAEKIENIGKVYGIEGAILKKAFDLAIKEKRDQKETRFTIRKQKKQPTIIEMFPGDLQNAQERWRLNKKLV